MATVVHEGAAAGSSSKLCCIFVLLTVIFWALLLKKVLPMADRLSSWFEETAGVLDEEQQTLGSSWRLSIIYPDMLE